MQPDPGTATARTDMVTKPSTQALATAAEIVKRNLHGEPVAMFAVCSAAEPVMEATLAFINEMQEQGLECVISLQGTCNQFDPSRRGYTRKTPQEFFDSVRALAAQVGVDPQRLLFGGDHLGTFLYRGEQPNAAMAGALAMTQAFVEAGIGLVHLDPSVGVAGESKHLPLEVVAERSALMCRVAERTANEMKVYNQLLYIVGTEVATPGGADAHDEGIKVTEPASVESMLAAMKKAFQAQGLGYVWDQGRVILGVTQPGMEFGPGTHVHQFDPLAAKPLGDAHRRNNVSQEGHSTDYNSEEALQQLVALGCANLKVGPELTWKMAEAYYALERIEAELLPEGKPRSKLTEVLLGAMDRNDVYWKSHCVGSTPEEIREDKLHGYSDRKRYYWPEADVQAALKVLFDNIRELSGDPRFLESLRRDLPNQAARVESLRVENTPEAIVRDCIREILVKYQRASNPESARQLAA